MDDFLARQIDLLHRLIDDYRRGRLSLNSLIQRIEGISQALGIAEWKDAVFPIVLSMEQVNAFALDAKRGLTEADNSSIEDSLFMLEELIKRFEARDL